jgi:alanyl-tRNA synthetase
MHAQRERARASAGRGVKDADRERIRAFAEGAGFDTTFTGYETVEQQTAIGAVTTASDAEGRGDEPAGRGRGRVLAKLVESPFYATGGGQVADVGEVRCEDGGCAARVLDVVRLGDDQALVLEPVDGELHSGERVIARVDRRRRISTEANHTATHLLHAALRERLGPHVRQAGSYVGPDKLRFDFTHGAPLTAEDVRWVEDTVNRWILSRQPVRALTTTLDEARDLGAMALFGEKYGDVVRMVEIGDGNWSRELCGGTHVRSTAEIGAFVIASETSSAANVRRIEAFTGQVAIDDLRAHARELKEAAAALRTSPENVAEVAAKRERERRELEKKGPARVDARIEPDNVRDLDGVRLYLDTNVLGAKALPDFADRIKNQLGDPAVVVLGSENEGRANLLVAATKGAVERGVKAGDIVKVAAKVVGGGGGGRDTMAQAGGRDPEKLPDALRAAEDEIKRVLAGA